MASREEILQAVKQNQPELLPLPSLAHFLEDEIEEQQQNQQQEQNLIAQFTQVVEGIGAKVYRVKSHQEIIAQIKQDFDTTAIRIVATEEVYSDIAKPFTGLDNHELADVELMILPAHFAVAENGACWVNDELYKERVLPFIPQHLALVVKKENFVPTMHHAYQQIGDKQYGFGTFIAGPSKTADIEQSLVLGAHGPRSLRVFVI
jgi:L-lactate dehydrogenase complex protein LldG